MQRQETLWKELSRRPNFELNLRQLPAHLLKGWKLVGYGLRGNMATADIPRPGEPTRLGPTLGRVMEAAKPGHRSGQPAATRIRVLKASSGQRRGFLPRHPPDIRKDLVNILKNGLDRKTLGGSWFFEDEIRRVQRIWKRLNSKKNRRKGAVQALGIKWRVYARQIAEIRL